VTLAFWDSSALVKLLVEEPGTSAAVALWDHSSALVASRLVVPEVAAALATAERTRRIDAARARVVHDEWRRYLLALDLVEVTADIAARGAGLVATHPLGGADAIHLATALALRAPELVAATWDRRLAAAAAGEGLVVVPEPMQP
jgi:predicted nucleic acid-binding protein